MKISKLEKTVTVANSAVTVPSASCPIFVLSIRHVSSCHALFLLLSSPLAYANNNTVIFNTLLNTTRETELLNDSYFVCHILYVHFIVIINHLTLAI